MRLTNTLLLILSAGLLTGCVSPQRIVVSDYCMIAQQITFTEADLAGMTESIAEQIETHNWMFERMCVDR